MAATSSRISAGLASVGHEQLDRLPVQRGPPRRMLLALLQPFAMAGSAADAVSRFPEVSTRKLQLSVEVDVGQRRTGA